MKSKLTFYKSDFYNFSCATPHTKHTHMPTAGQFPCEIAIKLMSRIRRVWQTHTLPAFYSARGMAVAGRGAERKAAAEQEQRAT